MAELEFFDLKTKKKFKTSKFTLKSKSGRKFAEAISPSGKKVARFVKKDFKG